MAGKPGSWAKGQKVVKTIDLGDGNTAEGVAIVDASGNQITSFTGGGGAVTVADGADVAQGTTTDAASANTLVGLLKAIKAAITGTVAVSGPATDAQLRATPLAVSGTVTTGGLTDAQLRAAVVPVSLTSTTVTGSVAVTGPLTDAQLRAAVVPIGDGAGSLTVDAPVATPVFVRLSDGVAAITTLPVSVSGTAATKETQPTVGTHANFTGSGAAQTVLASNENRRGGTLFNDSGVVVYVKFGASASSTSFLVKMVDQAYFEILGPVYTGDVTAFWASGVLRVCEIT